MKLVSTNREDHHKLIELSKILTDQSLTLSGKLNFSHIKELIDSPFWPVSVNEQLIVKTNLEIKERSESIIRYFLGNIADKKVLDFGCGTGGVVSAASDCAKTVVGYDIISHQDWSGVRALCTTETAAVRACGPYDIIMLYDVFDHIQEDRVDEAFETIRSVCHEKTIIKVRFHPFTSIHGAHLYNSYNKAYAHLFIPIDEVYRLSNVYVRKINRPLACYDEIIKKHGFKTTSSEIVKSDWNKDTQIGQIMTAPEVLSHIATAFDANEDWVKAVLPMEFIDYDLALDV